MYVLNDALIAAYRDVPKLANFLHLPVQSGSDRVLAAMGRRHTALEYKQKIRKLREVRPGICISSDFIVGFPGETEKDFEATMNSGQHEAPDSPASLRSMTSTPFSTFAVRKPP